jgi:signal peptide peptidase SppA
MPAIAPHSTATTTAPWQGGTQEKRLKSPMSMDVVDAAFAWRAAGSGMTMMKSDCKFIHHEVNEAGKPGAANLAACEAVIANLNGARSAPNIPSADRHGVWVHAAKHLEDAKREPTPLKGEGGNGEPLLEDNELDVLLSEIAGRATPGESGETALAREVSALPPLVSVGTSVWAITPDALPRIIEAHRTAGSGALAGVASAVVRSQRLAAATRAGGGVAIVPLTGVITPRGSLLSILFGGGMGGLEGFRANFREALNDPEVSAIVLNVDSPGGLISLVPETAAEIQDARGSKPIVAVANTMAASAAYWIAAQADEMVVTPSGQTGSIGVYIVHEDWSKFNEGFGVVPTYISAGKYKVEGNEDEPLSDAAMAAWQGEVDEIYGEFVDGVATGRGVSAADVRAGYGEGRTMRATPGVAAGLTDRVGTLEEVVGELLEPNGSKGPTAKIEVPEGFKVVEVDGALKVVAVEAPPASPSAEDRRRHAELLLR